MLPATIAMYRASLAQARGDVAGTSAHARRALDLAGPDHHFARGAAAAFLGLAAWADGDVPGALETFTQAVASLRAAGNLLDELSSTVILADMWQAAGRPGEARRICGNALRQADARGDSMARASAELHVALSEICRQAGDLSDAQDAPRDGRRVRPQRSHDRKPLPVVRGQRAGGPGPGRPGPRPPIPGPGRANFSGRGSSRTCGPSLPSKPGSGYARATCPRLPAGPVRPGLRSPTTSATCRSTATSPWCGC